MKSYEEFTNYLYAKEITIFKAYQKQHKYVNISLRKEKRLEQAILPEFHTLGEIHWLNTIRLRTYILKGHRSLNTFYANYIFYTLCYVEFVMGSFSSIWTEISILNTTP